MTTTSPVSAGVQIEGLGTEAVVEVPADNPRPVVLNVVVAKTRPSMMPLTVGVFLLLASFGIGHLVGLHDAAREVN